MPWGTHLSLLSIAAFSLQTGGVELPSFGNQLWKRRLMERGSNVKRSQPYLDVVWEDHEMTYCWGNDIIFTHLPVIPECVTSANFRHQMENMLKILYTLRKNNSPHCHHHLSQLSVDIQLNGLIECREDSGVQMKLTQVIFHSLSWIHLSQVH